MSGDQIVRVNDQLVGNTKNMDVSELTRADGTLVERQRVVIADPDDPTGFLSLSRLRFDRQALEISTIEAVEMSVNQACTRARERGYSTERRGGSTGRGAIR